MNMQQIDDSLELAALDAQPLFPGQEGRPLRLARSRFVKDPQQRLSCLRVRRHLVEDAGKVTVESSTHQLVNIKTLAVEKAGKRRACLARSLEEVIDEQRTGS